MPKSQYLLKTVFHFSDADLHANRNGRMSDRQKLRLRCMQVFSPWHIIAILLAISLSGDLIQHLSQINDGSTIQAIAPKIAYTVLVDVLVALFITERVWKLNRDINTGRVEMAKGVITYRHQYGRRSIRHFICLDGKEYRVTFWQQRAFRKNKEYAVYVAPQMKLVLSTERV
ncbi:MAG: hypothetical protein AAFR31_19860 [Cyanobacteria bacterium J06627_8]